MKKIVRRVLEIETVRRLRRAWSAAWVIMRGGTVVHGAHVVECLRLRARERPVMISDNRLDGGISIEAAEQP